MTDRRPTVPVPAASPGAGSATAAATGEPAGRRAPSYNRRQVLVSAAAAAALPALLAACSGDADQRADAGDALLAMADGARMDAALVAAAVTADPGLAGRLEPLRAARMAHATALDQVGGRTPGEVVAPATPPAADLAAVRDSVAASGRTAVDVATRASALQAGLVAEVAACCAAYAADLG
ncbi:hypothetical protein ACLFMI_25495 [Pseudonocardia nantongensis]|uniref:hypothetical protein n=1 Tax=Pseudonocardia nantongensis TaxID=1181885 RepID=UPI00397B1EAC